MGTRVTAPAVGAGPHVPATAPGTPRLVLSGATGRLGRAVAARAHARGWEFAGLVGGPRTAGAERSAGEAGLPGSSGRVVGPDRLAECLGEADVYVGCAPPAGEVGNLAQVAEAGCPVILATTGFSSLEEERLAKFAERVPILREPNFAPGLLWLREALARAPPLPAGFGSGLVEAHRAGKLDRPSATARSLAEDVGTLLPDPGTEPVTPVLSLRLGELPGIHQLWWASDSELLRVEHVALDRRAFAVGVVEAAERLVRARPLAPGVYRMSDLPPAAERHA